MIAEFSRLSASEIELMYKAPLLVCLLIAGADGKIDGKELAGAIGLANQPEWVNPKLRQYFTEASLDFEDKIKVLLQSYPYDAGQRNAIISGELEGLNNLWEKLGHDFSTVFQQQLRYIAEKIALSSGGFFRSKISEEEARLVGLPMLRTLSK